MDPTQHYELIMPILCSEKTVQDVHQETNVSIRTLYRYLKCFREGNGKLSSLADKSHACHSHPNWFTEKDKDKVVLYKLQHPHKSARQIAKDLTEEEILQINYHSTADILKERHLTELFFSR